MEGDRLHLYASINRAVRCKGWLIDGELCKFGDEVHGKFYIDVYAEETRNVTGTSNVKHYIKKGLRMKISGDFETKNPW